TSVQGVRNGPIRQQHTDPGSKQGLGEGEPGDRAAPRRGGEKEQRDNQREGVLDEGEREQSALALQTQGLFEFLFEKIQHGRIARSQSQTLQVEKLHEGDQAQQHSEQNAGERKDEHHNDALAMRAMGSFSLRRQRLSARAIAPPSRSWSMPSRCSRPWSMRMRISSVRECPNSRACSEARAAEIAISPSSSPPSE